MRQKGIRPKWRGGKRRGLTVAQKQLLAALNAKFGDVWVAEFAVPVTPRVSDKPSCYYLDIAHKHRKIAIEVDGNTHTLRQVQEADLRKTTHLESQGWQVLRFWNQEILDSIDTVIKTVVSSFMTSK